MGFHQWIAILVLADSVGRIPDAVRPGEVLVRSMEAVHSHVVVPVVAAAGIPTVPLILGEVGASVLGVVPKAVVEELVSTLEEWSDRGWDRRRR